MAKINNPNGKKGGLNHQAKIDEISKEIQERGLYDVTEYPVSTPTGKKKVRHIDVAGIDKNTLNPKEFHQVGLLDKNGNPIKREQEAIEDIEKHSIFKIKVTFHSYK